MQKLDDIIENPILRTYRTFKKDFEIEPYLKKVTLPKYRRSITKLRTCSHDLQIEKCRHNTYHIPIEARLCAYCDLVEDEKHFLISCNLFENERREFF